MHTNTIVPHVQERLQKQAAAAELRAGGAARRGVAGGKGGKTFGGRGGGAKGGNGGEVNGEGKGGEDDRGANRGGEVEEQSALQLMQSAVMLHPSVIPRLHR